ncbi:MAG: 2-iminobutanoate/2-iminopropanoate deaminase [Rhodothermales bacterium]|jgi:2-iminobutanoate/2-iminopropanoate deaminase
MRRKTVTIPRTRVKTPLAPAAIGPYSQAVQVGDTLYCSGQIALDRKSGLMITDGIELEAELVLENLGAVLKAAGMDYCHVVRCSVFLTDINDYAQVNEVYARYFSDDAPARDTIQAAALPRGARVEISCVAVR